MTEYDWENLGENIKRTVQDAIRNGNYDRLNETITNTINQASFWMNQKNQKYHTRTRYEKRSSSKTYQREEFQHKAKKEGLKERKNNRATLYRLSTKDILIPVAFVGTSILVGCLALMPMLFSFLKALIFFQFKAMMSATLGMIGILVLWLITLILGAGEGLRIGRFKKYVKRIGFAEYCNIADLAETVRKNNKYVIRDLEKMIKRGWFREGHLDKQKTCLITSNQMYEQYLELEDRKEKERLEEELEKQRQEQIQNAMPEEIKEMVEQGNYYLRKLRECNDAIPGEEVSEKIARIEVVVDRIFERVRQHPESLDDIHKLMEYYLPMTIKLLEAYAEMDAQPVDGPNIQNSKKEIEDTLDTLHAAFEKLLDELFEDTAWDISTDISVLHSMLAQEGLKEDDWKKQ